MGTFPFPLHCYLRRIERVSSRARLSMQERTHQLNESKFLLTSRKHKILEIKCRVKSRTKLARNICFYLEILLGDHPIFLHACNTKNGFPRLY